MIGGPLAAKAAIGAVLAAGVRRSAAWTPLAFVGLRAWYRASSLSLADGAAVAQWDDESGNGYHISQGTGTKQPAYRTADVSVDFDGSSDALVRTSIPAVSVARGLIAIVAKPDVNTTERFWFLARDSGGFTTMMRYRASLSGQNVSINNLVITATTGLSTVAYQLWLAYTNAGNVYIRKNGVQVATAAGTPTTRNFTDLYVGGESGIANYFDGRIKEIVYVTRSTASEFSAEDITALETYLMTTHGIA